MVAEVSGGYLRHSELLSFVSRLLYKQHIVAINTCSASFVHPLSQNACDKLAGDRRVVASFIPRSIG